MQCNSWVHINLQDMQVKEGIKYAILNASLENLQIYHQYSYVHSPVTQD